MDQKRVMAKKVNVKCRYSLKLKFTDNVEYFKSKIN